MLSILLNFIRFLISFRLEEPTKVCENDMELLLDQEDEREARIILEVPQWGLHKFESEHHQIFPKHKYLNKIFSETPQRSEMLNSNFCGRKFSHQCLLDVRENILFACEKCDEIFFIKEEFKEHVKRHLRTKNTRCSFCNQLFPESRIQEHLKTQLAKRTTLAIYLSPLNYVLKTI